MSIEDKPYYFRNEQFRPTCMNTGCSKLVHEVKKHKNRTVKYRYNCDRCRRLSREELIKIGIIQTKKDYCENRDGRLGFKCTTTIVDESQLQLDHIDGNRENNTPENAQTFCADCHAVKTKRCGDHNGLKYSHRKHGTVEKQQEIFNDLFT